MGPQWRQDSENGQRSMTLTVTCVLRGGDSSGSAYSWLGENLLHLTRA